jgi:hypothetical protein
MMTLHIVVKDKNIEYDDIRINRGVSSMREDVWAERAKGLLKAELKRRNVGYRELAEKLTAQGTPETERNLANKISRGGFTAAFLIQCLTAIGVDTLRL